MSGLPAGWRAVPIGEVADLNPRPAKDAPDDTLVSFIPMRCVEEESGRFHLLEDRRVADVRKGYTAFRNGDVIFAKVTPCMENGKAAVVAGLTNGLGFGSTEFHVFRPRPGLEARYLLHFLLQSTFRRDAERHMTGAVGLRRVPKSYLEQQPIPLPPLDEQRRLVAEIEKQFTRLDAGAAALRQVQAKLKRYRAAVLQAACEGRLVPTEAALARQEGGAYESAAELLARILAERRDKGVQRGTYRDAVVPMVASLPPLPVGWTWATVEQLAEIGSGNTPAGVMGMISSEGEVPWFKVGDMNHPDNTRFMRKADSYLSQEAIKKLGMKRFQPGTIVFPKRGGAIATNKKRLLEAEATTDLNVMGLTAKPELRPYFWWWFASIDLASFSDGSNVPQVNNKDICPISIPLPPLAEQARIVAEVERRLSVADALAGVAAASVRRAGRLRQAILQRAFGGQLLPTRS